MPASSNFTSIAKPCAKSDKPMANVSALFERWLGTGSRPQGELGLCIEWANLVRVGPYGMVPTASDEIARQFSGQ